MRQFRTLLILFVIMLSTAVSAFAQDSPAGNRVSGSILQVGVQYAYRPFSGIVVKGHVSDKLMLQGTVTLTEWNGSVGARLLYDLGVKGDVFRYTGFGAAVGYYSDWSATLGDHYRTELGVEAFIGIDYPLTFFGKNTPLSASLEVALQAVTPLQSGTFSIVPRTGVNAGLHYWF